MYNFKNFNNIYILQNYLSCHALKIKSIQIIFKQETHSNIISTLTIHKRASLNFDDIRNILAQTHSISITAVSQYCAIITHVRTSENHHFTAYLYQQ